MPVTIAWDNDEHSVIRVTFEQRWEVSDLIRTSDAVSHMIGTVDHMVDSIFDLTDSSMSPPRLLSTLDRMEDNYRKNQRLLIIVSAGAYIKSLTKVAKLLAPKTFTQIHFADTLESAYALIQRYSPVETA